MNVTSINNIQQAVEVSLEVKKEQESLAEKILAAISHTAEKAKGGPAAYLTKAHATITSLQTKATDEQKPILDTVLQSLSNQLSVMAPASPKSMRRKMKAVQSVRAEFVSAPAPKTMKSAAPASSVGADQPLPVPSLPPSKAPSYDNIPDGQMWLLQDPLSAVKQFFEYIYAHPSDPTAMMNLMNFLSKLTAAGKMTPQIQDMLKNNGDLLGSGGGIEMWSNQMAEYAFFAGYKGQTGEAGMDAYLKDTLATLQGLPANPFTNEMIARITDRIQGAAAFTTAHTDATTGDYIWTYDGVTYDWSKPGTADFNDQEIIQSLMNGQSTDGTLNPFMSNLNLLNMEKDYRVTALDELLKQFKSDPLMAITLWLLQSDDNQTESKVSGENENTDVLTKATNVFANDITDSISAFAAGSGNNADVGKLADALFGAHVYFDQTPQLSPIAGQFDTDVYQGLSNISVTAPDGTKTTLGDYLKAARNNPSSWGGIAQQLNMMFSSTTTPSAPVGPTPGPAPTPTANSNFQLATNITNEMSSLTTGQSKTISTEQANDVSTISAIIKTADAVISLQKMYDKVIQHFGD